MILTKLTDYKGMIRHGAITLHVCRDPRSAIDYYVVWGTRGCILYVPVDKVPPWQFHPKRGLYV